MKRYLFPLFLCLPFVGKGQIITTYAGNGQVGYTGDGGLATNAAIGFPGFITYDKFGNLFISALNNTIRKVSNQGIITKIAGTGVAGYSGDDSLAINAKFSFIGGGGMTCDSLGNVFIADQGNNRVRKIDISTGIVTTIAGTGVAGFSGDNGPAISALLNSPVAVTFDDEGNLYVYDGFNYRIRKINSAGVITTIAGIGTMGLSGDGGLASDAQLGGAGNIKVDYSNNLLIAEGVKVRRIDLTSGIITTIAGTGNAASYNGDGISATLADLWGVTDVTSDVLGNVYLVDYVNSRIRKVDISNIIHTVAGTGVDGYNGDTMLSNTAQLFAARGIALDSCGNLYISDNGNHRIRKVSFNPNCFPLKVNTPTPLTFTLSPNPTTSHITIISSTLLKKLHLTNILGATILQQEINANKATLHIANQPTGIYFLTLYDEHGNRRTEKIIKE